MEQLLINLGICKKDSIKLYHPRTRDRADLSVLKCDYSGVIFLSNSKHLQESYYNNMTLEKYWGTSNRAQKIKNLFIDDKRRFEQFKNTITNKKWLDIGTGPGGILDLLNPYASKVIAIELQDDIRKLLKSIGYKVFKSINEIKSNSIEVVTIFHVFEHFVDPIKILNEIKEKMCLGGKIIIEVPHANDILMLSPEFKSFTFWSEHLILHTEKSLRIFLKEVGFKNIKIRSYQRYSFLNHLNWFLYGKPNNKRKCNKFYSRFLSFLGKTDTLIATAIK